jgi:pimeloyl-ACP methyl ester carboxylesterase
MSILPVGNVTIFVREMGENSPDVPPLLVIHGGPDWDNTYLLPGLELVAQSRRVVAFDLRGCGQSTQGLGYDGYQPELVVGDVERLIGVLGHERVDLLGFSTGGQIAQLFVEAHPGRVRRLVLASTTAYPDVDRYLHGWAEYEARLAVRVPWPQWAGFRRGRARNDAETVVEWAIEGAPTAIWDLDRLDEYLGLLAGVRFTGEWIRSLREGRLHPWRPSDPVRALGDFPGRILVLHGAQDMSFPVQMAEQLHREVPRSQLTVIQSAGHMAHFDEPEEWAGAVVTFLAADDH